MDFYEKWLEYDYNPWILFDSGGRVKTLNQEAQFLLAEVEANEIFELAITYANQSYGFKTTMIDLKFGKYEFFGIMVGYEDSENIAIHLYQKPPERILKPHLHKLSSHNIYTLIDLAISTNSINRKNSFTTTFDPAFPEIKIDPQSFVKVINGAIACMEDTDIVDIKLSLKTGETVKFDGKRHPIFQLSICGKLSSKCNISILKEISTRLNGRIVKQMDCISIEAPLIV